MRLSRQQTPRARDGTTKQITYDTDDVGCLDRNARPNTALGDAAKAGAQAAADSSRNTAITKAAMARRALAGRLVSPKLFSLPPLVYLNSRVRRSCQAAPPNPPSPRREVAGEDIEADLDDEDQLEV